MHYLDHAATTPMYPEVIAVMTTAMADVGNSSSLHTAGRRAKRHVEESRERLAAALGARPSEVVFTSGGTESDNLAVKGIYRARREADERRRRVVVSAIEHHAVLDAVEWLVGHEGAELVEVPVDEAGRVHPYRLREVIEGDPDSVALVSIMWANNEVGTVQPIVELASVAHEFDLPFHTDAVQAVGAVPVSFADSAAEALTMTGHKIGGPHGIGALLVRRDLAVSPLFHGGGQERDMRSGTLDTPAIIGLARAAELATATINAKAETIGALREALIDGVRARVPDVVLNGDRDQRIPGNVHLSFPGCEGDALLMLLDAAGIECSTGSACNAGVAQPSHVLLAMGRDEPTAKGSLRFSLGHTTTAADIDAVIEAIGPAVERARKAGVAMGVRA